MSLREVYLMKKEDRKKHEQLAALKAERYGTEQGSYWWKRRMDEQTADRTARRRERTGE